ncbi:MAG: hypothetical protein M1823_006404, partial [Watsoniomyces obsoletus]
LARHPSARRERPRASLKPAEAAAGSTLSRPLPQATTGIPPASSEPQRRFPVHRSEQLLRLDLKTDRTRSAGLASAGAPSELTSDHSVTFDRPTGIERLRMGTPTTILYAAAAAFAAGIGATVAFMNLDAGGASAPSKAPETATRSEPSPNVDRQWANPPRTNASLTPASSRPRPELSFDGAGADERTASAPTKSASGPATDPRPPHEREVRKAHAEPMIPGKTPPAQTKIEPTPPMRARVDMVRAERAALQRAGLDQSRTARIENRAVEIVRSAETGPRAPQLRRPPFVEQGPPREQPAPRLVAKLPASDRQSLVADKDARGIVTPTRGLKYADANRIENVKSLIRDLDCDVTTTHYLGSPWPSDNSPSFIDSHGLLDLNAVVIFSHGGFIPDADIKLLREKNHYLSITPESEMHYGHGQVASRNCQDRASLGIDTAWTFSGDILTQARIWLQSNRQGRFEKVLSEGDLPKNTPMTAEQAFLLATRQGGLALRKNDIGVLKEGAKADVVIFNGDSPGMLGWSDPVAAVVLHANVGDIE